MTSVTDKSTFDVVKAFRESDGDVTLGLSFWEQMCKELRSLTARMLNYDHKPYLLLNELPIDRSGVYPAVPHQLTISSDLFQLSATLDPLSQTIFYVVEAVGVLASRPGERTPVDCGTMHIAFDGIKFRFSAKPALEDLSLEDAILGDEEFWEIPLEVARWICGSILLRPSRMKHLGKLASSTIHDE